MPVDADAVLWICRLCGVEAGPSAAPPPGCPICQDVRVNWLYATEWGARVLMRGGEGRRGQVTPPAWRSTRSR
jgi:hypothetical protein